MGIKIVFFILLIPSFCLAQSLLLAHPLSDKAEYLYKINSESEYFSYIDHLLSEQSLLTQLFAESFAQAREAEFRNEIGSARIHFKKVVQISERFIKLSSQQAQLLKSSLESLQKLSDSLVEAKHYEVQISKMSALFEGSSDKLLWMPHDQLKDYDYISVNGRLFEITTSLRIPLSEGRYRVTALSNRYQPAYLNAGYDELTRWKPDSMPFLGGDCLSPQLLYPLHVKVNGFFGTKCVSHFNDKKELIPPRLKEVPQVKRPWALGAVLIGAAVVYSLKDKEVHWQKP